MSFSISFEKSLKVHSLFAIIEISIPELTELEFNCGQSFPQQGFPPSLLMLHHMTGSMSSLSSLIYPSPLPSFLSVCHVFSSLPSSTSIYATFLFFPHSFLSHPLLSSSTPSNFLLSSLLFTSHFLSLSL